MGLRDRIRIRVQSSGGVRGLARELLGREEPPRPAPGAAPPAPAPPAPAPAPPAAVPSDGPWRDVAAAAAVREQQAVTVRAGEDAVAIFRVQGQLFAIDQTCVHEDGPLGEGRVDGHVVTCPYHDWRYDLRDGRCLTEPSRAVACFAVREEGGRVLLGPRRTQGSADRGGRHDDGLAVIERR